MVDARKVERDVDLDWRFMKKGNEVYRNCMPFASEETRPIIICALAREKSEATFRSFDEVAVKCGVTFIPNIPFLPLPHGVWHLHCCDGNVPTSVPIHVSDGTVEVYDKTQSYVFRDEDMTNIIESSGDRREFTFSGQRTDHGQVFSCISDQFYREDNLKSLLGLCTGVSE